MRDILALASTVLLVAVFHEPGRNFNTVFIPALKGAGDVRFPVYIGSVSMWGVAVAGGWLLGIHLGWRRHKLIGAADAGVAEVSAVEIEEGI